MYKVEEKTIEIVKIVKMLDESLKMVHTWACEDSPIVLPNQSFIDSTITDWKIHKNSGVIYIKKESRTQQHHVYFKYDISVIPWELEKIVYIRIISNQLYKVYVWKPRDDTIPLAFYCLIKNVVKELKGVLAKLSFYRSRVFEPYRDP